MGLFSSSSQSPLTTTPSHQTPQRSSDGAFIAPDRTARDICWAARDTYFSCLDKHHIIDSIKQKDEAEKFCGAEGRGLEKDCVGSWVTYFKKRRVMEYKRKETLEKLAAEGAKPMPEGMGPPGVR